MKVRSISKTTESTYNFRFSVVMAVYHRDQPQHVSQAIESILNQTLQPDEIIIVFDGPVDGQLNRAIKTYEDNVLVRIHRLPENKGLANALNVGISKARYPLIARMDADDFSYENRFELQISFLRQFPDIDVLGGNLLEFEGEDMDIRTVRKVPELDKEIKRKGKLICPINHPTVIFRKDKFLEVGGYNEQVFPEDYYLWLRMFKHGLKFHNLQEPLLLMRVDQGMINRRSGRAYLKKELNFLKVSYKEGLLSLPHFLIHTMFRSTFRLLPTALLERSYIRFFRKKHPSKNTGSNVEESIYDITN